MAYPYNTSGDMHLRMIIEKLQNVFPKEITKETIQRLGIAPKGESYIITTLKFINLIDNEGNAVSESKALFKKMGEDFQIGFAEIVKNAYAPLFELHGEDAWELSDDKLIPFFRQSDDVSPNTARRQVQTFKVLKEFSGKKDAKITRVASTKPSETTKSNTIKKDTPKSNVPKSAPITTPTEKLQLTPSGNFALSVRIEVNLPAGGTKADYDNIFQSIRENLINE